MDRHDFYLGIGYLTLVMECVGMSYINGYDDFTRMLTGCFLISFGMIIVQLYHKIMQKFHNDAS